MSQNFYNRVAKKFGGYGYGNGVGSKPRYKSEYLTGDPEKIFKEKLEQVLTEELDRLLAVTSKEESFQNIQGRLRDQKEGLIRALLETQSGTNNLGERELRPLVPGRKVSYGSDTYTGMETTAILASITQTLSRDRQKDLLTELTLDLQIGIHQKYPQYQHLVYQDTS